MRGLFGRIAMALGFGMGSGSRATESTTITFREQKEPVLTGEEHSPKYRPLTPKPKKNPNLNGGMPVMAMSRRAFRSCKRVITIWGGGGT